jgi:hypothetical protein
MMLRNAAAMFLTRIFSVGVCPSPARSPDVTELSALDRGCACEINAQSDDS